MRRHVVVALAAASAVLASYTPALAQSWRADIGVNGGGAWYSNALGTDKFGGSGDPVRFKPGYLTGAQAGIWFTPRIGIRANMTYTDDKFSQGSSNTLYGDVNLWSGTGDLMIRLKAPAATMTHMEALPYIALGAGKKWINPAADLFASSNGDTGLPFVCGSGINSAAGGNCVGPAVGAGTNFFLAEASRFMGLVGLGTDLRLAPNFALRLEVGDRMYKPLIYGVNAPAAGTFPTPPGFAAGPASVTATSTDNVAKLVNEVYGQVGLHMLLGVGRPPVIAVTPTPAPPPPPPPPPPPAPVPTTQDVSVCVVDPTATGGLRSATAQFNPTTGDTTVMVNGTATAFKTTVGTVPVATNAQWYVQGQPLTIGTGRNSIAYVSFGTARNVAPTDLTYVGMVNGLPVYASTTDLTGITVPAPPGEIGTNTALVTGLRKVQVLYVPVSSYGCNFQPIQLQQAVRKVRG